MTEPNQLIPWRSIFATLPDPQDLRRELRAAVETSFQRARAEQGTVSVPEDTYALQRRLAAAWEFFDGYARAFTDARKLVASMQEEQLIDAVGEQAGIPNQGLVIPDPDGDVRLSLEYTNAYTFDLDQLIAVVATRVAAEMRSVDCEDIGPGSLEAGITAAINQFLALGKFEPQVTKVKAYAGQVAREGADALSAVVTGAIGKTSDYKSVKFERKPS